MFICFFYKIFFVLCFNHHGTPTESFPENFVTIRLDLAEILRISKLDWRDEGGKKGRRKRRRGGILLCNGLMFICLFVFLFVELFVFYFNHLGTPTGIYPENFVKIGLDLAEIYRILKNVYLFVCLFVCLLNCLFFILIILGHPQEYTLKISWGSDLIWLRY